MSSESMNYLQFENFNLVGSYCRQKMTRGGVSIYTRNNINLELVTFNHCIEQVFEIMISVLSTNNFKMYVMSFYRSPKSDFKVFIDHLYDLMCSIYKPEIFYVFCGDINVDLLVDNNESRQVKNMFSEFNMRNVVNKPTRITLTSATLIDVMFTNMYCSEVLVQETHVSDHTFQIGKLHASFMFEKTPSVVFKRDLSDSNILTFRYLLASLNWGSILNICDFQNRFKEFYNTFLYYYKIAFPFKKYRVPNKSHKTWFSTELRHLQQMVFDFASIVKTTDNEVVHRRFKELKNIYDRKLKIAKHTFNDKRIVNSSNTSRESWKIVNEQRGGSATVFPEEMVNLKGERVTGHKQICNELNDHFLNISSLEVSNGVILSEHIDKSFFLTPTSPFEIEIIGRKTCGKPSSGYDEIDGRVVKAVLDVISNPLSNLINDSFQNGVFPNVLKVSKSIPLFKNKGSRNEFANYRNISLLSQFSKIFETAYCIRLAKFLESNGLLVNSQHGFRSNKSTSTAIADLSTFIYNGLNNRMHPLTLSFDLSKAFDSVNHLLLLEKLNRQGVRGATNEWIRSYLENRQQSTYFGNSRSDFKEVTVGVPQGSILGPLLFLAFVNDTSNYCRSFDLSISYADDTNFGLIGSNMEELIIRANALSHEFQSYCDDNGLLVNVSKSSFTTFLPKNLSYDRSPLLRISNTSIEHVKQAKFLGIIIDEKLTWEGHVDYVTTRLSGVCFLIRQMKSTVSFNILRLMYFSLAQSILSYGLIFWGSSSHLNKAFSIQKNILRAMMGLTRRTSCRPYFVQQAILTLPSLYIYQLVLNIQRNPTQRVATRHNYDTRGKNKLFQPFSRLTLGQNSHIYMGIKCYNKFVELEGERETANEFRQKMLTFLSKKAFYSVTEFLNYRG